MNKSFIYAVIIGIIICTLPNFGSRKLPDDQYLQRLGEKLFGISLKELQPEIIDIKEQWCPNGDGTCIIRFKFNPLNTEKLKYLNPLPIKEKEHVPYRFKTITKGYYKVNLSGEFKFNGVDKIFYRNIELIIFNTETHEGILFREYT